MDGNSEASRDLTKGTLYLFPSLLSDCPVADVLPQLNIEIIRRVRYFVVENVRTARRFLKACDRNINIDELNFTVLNVNSDPVDLPNLITPLKQGHDVGIISEAGCPAVADPGALLVDEAQRLGFKVVPLVGPSSILLALMGSGFSGQQFAFNGYLPIERTQRVKELKRLLAQSAKEDRTQIFIETPYRNNKLIEIIIETLPDSTRLCVAADLTGNQQKIISKPLRDWKKLKYDFDKIPTIFLIYGR